MTDGQRQLLTKRKPIVDKSEETKAESTGSKLAAGHSSLYRVLAFPMAWIAVTSLWATQITEISPIDLFLRKGWVAIFGMSFVAGLVLPSTRKQVLQGLAIYLCLDVLGLLLGFTNNAFYSVMAKFLNLQGIPGG